MYSDNFENLTTEQKILKAAQKEFSQKGFAGAKTTAIAKAAGVTHTMLHYYFRTKKCLYEKIVDEYLSIMLKVIFTPDISMSRTIFDSVHLITERQMNSFAQNPYLPQFIINELSLNTEILKIFISKSEDYSNQFLSILQKQIYKAALNHKCKKVDARVLAIGILQLNIIPFIVAPILSIFRIDNDIKDSTFIASKIQENTNTIINRLQP